ncbi:MAG TPA: hypothetical protein VFV43_01065 [Limnobacter sp.]|nr:hypothetical protein [Limnobacter sp.]
MDWFNEQASGMLSQHRSNTIRTHQITQSAMPHVGFESVQQSGRHESEKDAWQALQDWWATHAMSTGFCRIAVSQTYYEWQCAGFSTSGAAANLHSINIPLHDLLTPGSAVQSELRGAKSVGQETSDTTLPPEVAGWVDLPHGRVHFDAKNARWSSRP